MPEDIQAWCQNPMPARRPRTPRTQPAYKLPGAAAFAGVHELKNAEQFIRLFKRLPHTRAEVLAHPGVQVAPVLALGVSIPGEIDKQSTSAALVAAEIRAVEVQTRSHHPWHPAHRLSQRRSGDRGLGGQKAAAVYAHCVTWREQFVRPRRGRVVAGVCAAIADRYGSSRTGVRVLFVASLLLPGPQILVYLVGWAVFPKEPAGPPAP